MRERRAHPARFSFICYSSPDALCRFFHHRIIRCFRANLRSDLIQDVVEFFVLHDLSPKMMSEPPALVGGHNELLPMFLQITADLFSQTRARTVQRDAYDEGRRIHQLGYLAIVEPFKVAQRKYLSSRRAES